MTRSDYTVCERQSHRVRKEKQSGKPEGVPVLQSGTGSDQCRIFPFKPSGLVGVSGIYRNLIKSHDYVMNKITQAPTQA